MDENLSRGYIQLGHNTWVDRVTRRGISAHHAKPPLDRCNCVYLALVLAGVGFLLPYNSFIIAVDYFQAKYPSTTIVFDMSLVYILVAFGAVVINNLLVETLPLHVRLSFGYLSSFATLLFVALFEVLWDAFEHDVGYTVNLVAVAVVAFGCTVQQSSFYGYTSMLPSRYTQAVMTGESAAGLLVSINRLLTKALLSDEQINTLLFFGISVVVVLLCFIIQSVVQRTRFVRFYLSLCSGNEPENDDLHKRIILEPAEDVGLVDMLDPTESKTGKYGVLSLRSPPGSPSSAGGHLVANVDSAFESSDVLAEEDSLWRHSDASSLPRTGSDDLGHLGSESHFRVQDVVVRMRGGRSYNKHVQWWSGIKRGVLARAQVARSVWPYMLSIALAYFVTLCLFPGIESEIVSCRLGSWMPVLLMALFNLSDFLGKAT
ncbi:equilibrative nucleoside transporter 4-like isoform X2 [Ornithodoros turicata]|uniref:equilibrative nucleoside transporter 4-like isoform X2 n=1 Tax=Ornithodoros turicata TaxID=34597 RepID=UPI00313A332F